VPLPPGPDDDAGSPLSNPDRQFPVQASSVNCVAFNPTGHWMATAGEDKIITIWDFSEMRLTLQLRGHADAVTSIAFSPDGKILASGSRDKTVRLWDATTGRALQTLAGHNGEVSSVAISPDGLLIASGSADDTVKLWNMQSSSSWRTLRGHSGAVNVVAFSQDGKTLASASEDRTVRLWDVQTGGLFQTLAGHAEPVFAVEFSPDGGPLASGSGYFTALTHRGALKLWNAETGRESSAPPFRFSISALAFRPDGKALALGYFGSDHHWDIDILDLQSGRLLRHYVAHRRRITQLAYSPDGAWLASVSSDKFIRCWH